VHHRIEFDFSFLFLEKEILTPGSKQNRELGREYECTVNAIAPGAQNTEGFREVPDDFRATLEPMLAATPLGHRVGEPEEVAYAAAFFCEERARWMTGVILSVNGGTLMI
jgi:NAD(P)-dependent dehydrogenase (short-subunit alcohol dehydrogenase family)